MEALASEAARLLTSFSSWLIDEVMREARMCTCSVVVYACIYVYMCTHASIAGKFDVCPPHVSNTDAWAIEEYANRSKACKE